MILHQFFDSDSSSYTYLIASFRGSDALIIDPVEGNVSEYLKVLKKENLRLIYVLDTHLHDDHVSGVAMLRQETHCITLAHILSLTTKVSRRIQDGDTISLTGIELMVIHTPGHTQDSVCLYFREAGLLFTGDTIWVRGNGHCNGPDGSAADLFDSIHNRVFVLPDETTIYPGHDTKGENLSIIGRARRQNEYFAGRTRADFIKVMESLSEIEPPPNAISSNREIGKDLNDTLYKEANLSCQGLMDHLDTGKAIVIDLRDRTEINKTGSISGALNIPYLDVEKSLEVSGRLNKILTSGREVIFVCAHGERSSLTLRKMADEHKNQCFHLSDGISVWESGGYPLL